MSDDEETIQALQKAQELKEAAEKLNHEIELIEQRLNKRKN
jgi:hypothetical protein